MSTFTFAGFIDTHCLTTVQAIATPIGAMGGAFMLHPDTLTPAKQVGYPGGFSYYVVGRGGVLGDVNAAVVISAFAFFAPSLVRPLWENGVVVEGARKGADRYALACAEWGRQRLQAFVGADRLVELLEKLIDAADPSGLALFAGWQSQTRVDDSIGRCYQLIHVLRELRGSVHIVATLAHGLTPLQTLLANPGSGGAQQAERFGWAGDFPDGQTLLSTFRSAETLTDVLMTRHMSALSNTEQVELVELINQAHAIISH